MNGAARKPRSFDDLYAEIAALPEGQTGMILEPGQLTVMPRPHPKHQRALAVLRHALAPRDADLGGAGWWLLSEIEVRLGERLLVPDILGYRVETLPEPPADNPMLATPDFCCEILSPSSARDDRLRKLRIYAAHGVRWTWLVDPDARSIECYEAVDGLPRQAVVAAAGDATAGDAAASPVLPPFDLPLAIDALWGATPRAT